MEIPDELIRVLKQQIMEHSTTIIKNFQQFCLEFERNGMKMLNRDQDIEHLSQSRELPKVYLASAISRSCPPNFKNFIV
jgi:hypothetical protein